VKIAIILNGISFQKSLFFKRILPLLQASYPVETFETLSRHDAINLASKAVDKGFDVILAAGGDGTVHQVLNGILKGNETLARLPVLGVLPIGTGNDFARSVLRSVAYHETLNLLAAKESNTIDIGRITFTTETGEKDSRYFVNVVDTGMGPEVVQKVLNSGRPFGSALAYYSSILSTFFR
jgi:diacylglycerol kinase (ATP)